VAGIIQSLTSLKKNLGKAKARVLVFGTLSAMILVVLAGTVFVLRLSYSPVVRQYQAGIHRTLQRVVSEFEGFEGRTAFINMNRSSPALGLPLIHLPLDYLNYLPGHIEELRPLAACSYPFNTQPGSEMCAGILDSRKAGAMAYIQGSFDLEEELSVPAYSKSPTTGHHFLLSIEAKGVKQAFVVTFDPLRRADALSKSTFSPAWSLTGFRYLGEGQKSYVREPDIKGRVLLPDSASSHYRYIFQAPIQAFMADAVSDSKPWPPSDLTNVKISMKVVAPDYSDTGRAITDTANLAESPRFTFSNMSQYLASGEKLTFRAPAAVRDAPVEVESVESSAQQHHHQLRMALEHVADALIRAVIPSISTQRNFNFDDGSAVELNGNASLILSGWRAAAQGTIAFAMLLCTSLVIAGFILYRFLLEPLNNLRRNTLYLRDKFQDAENFRLPYTIKNERDEVGVLWASILDLHKSITSYGREALESTKKQAEFLRALGHEIKSPLQELTMRHSNTEDPSFKSIKRITHALKILSATQGEGSTSPAMGPQEAISSYRGTLTREDVSEYLQNAADENPNVIYDGSIRKLMVSADGDMLEAALTAILNNANDFRAEGTRITITGYTDAQWVLISIMNYGPHIKNYPIEEVFEYGVSSRSGDGDHGGLGLYMAKKNITNMGGDLVAKNVEGGVRLEIKLVRIRG